MQSKNLNRVSPYIKNVLKALNEGTIDQGIFASTILLAALLWNLSKAMAAYKFSTSKSLQ